MPLIFLHCVLNTDVFSFLFGPVDDHLWLKHYIRHVHIYVDSTLLFSLSSGITNKHYYLNTWLTNHQLEYLYQQKQ